MTALCFTLGSFALILILARLRVPLWLGIFAGAIAIGIAFGLDAGQIASGVLYGTIKARTFALAIITASLLIISEILQTTGQLERIVGITKAFFRRPAVTMAALPALIGLLPMPGGALFSAPMVKSAAGESKNDSGLMSGINYWFRHVWEHAWPLYPGVILAISITQSDVGMFVAFQFPLCLAMIAAGVIILRRVHPDLQISAPKPPTGTKWKLLGVTSPIWVILIVWAIATIAFKLTPAEYFAFDKSSDGQQNKRFVLGYIPMILGLVVSLFWTIKTSGIEHQPLLKIFTHKSIYKLVALIVSVMIFQELLARVDAAPKIAEELKSIHVPVVLVVMILPFIAGMVTGVAMGFVGISFPIVLGLVTTMPGGPSIRPYVALAYAWGHLGQMMSPLHICHIVSNEYFGTTFGPSYRNILPAGITMAVLGTTYFAILNFVLN